MNIAIVGGGTKCKLFLEFLERHAFYSLNPRVVALIDAREDAPCVQKARENGLYVSDDYNDLFERGDIDLIIELTGNPDVFFDILSKKKKTVRAFDSRTAELFWEVSRIAEKERKIEKEFQKTKVTYGVIMNELIHEELMVISPAYEILDVNDSLLKKLGRKREETIGRRCFEISHHQDIPCQGEHHPCPLRETLRTTKPCQATHVHFDKEGNDIHYSISSYPIFDQEELVAVAEISKDITRDIKLEKTMMQQQKLASIGRLAAGVAHEINNPMTTILTTAMLLQEEFDPDDPAYRELKIISDETLRCRKIVTSLLNFARESKPIKKTHEINNIVSETIALTRKQAAFENITIISKLSEGLPPLNVDKDQIQQALINISLNAIEAIKGGGTIVVTTRLSPRRDAVEILVSDTGEGIPPDHLNNIFEPFFTTKETGMGLGMAITYGLIKRHGGTIKVESRPGEGTTFQIRLPLDNVDNEVVDAA